MHSWQASALILTAIALSTCGLATHVYAQDAVPAQAETGLRPLTWAGRTTSTVPVARSTSYTAPSTARPNVLPRGGYQINPTPYSHSVKDAGHQRQGLTPASAFYGGPAPRPVPFPPPLPAPRPPVAVERAFAVEPAQVAVPEAAPMPPSGPTRFPVAEAQAFAPSPMPPPSPAPAPAPAAPPSTTATADSDPMAPRRDAPIFRLAPQTAAPVQQAGSTPNHRAAAPSPAYGQSRYYSVHRQYGRQPDPTPTPAPIYLDALPVDVTGMSGTTDIAEPPAPPTLIRNHNGRLQALPDLGDVGP